MKGEAALLGEVERRLRNGWAAELADELLADELLADELLAGDRGDQDRSAQGDRAARWPHAFALRRPTGDVLASNFADVVGWAADWRSFARRHGLFLRETGSRVAGTSQLLPSHLVLDGIDAAAGLIGTGWPERLVRGRARAARLHREFPQLGGTGRLGPSIAAIDGFTDVDVDLLVRAAAWFGEHDAAGLTPRQVPIEGMQAKWLNTRRHLVLLLAGLADLRLAPEHPPRVHFSYLDQSYRNSGGRLHDSVTLGDPMRPAYLPDIVIISENKDTAIHFPALAGAVSVEGVGRGGGTIAAVDWLAGAEHVVYWGDMDADGLEILDGFRAAGVPATSMFMDLTAYQRWERFGTNLDPKGGALQPRPARPVPHLTAAELDLYRALIAPGWTRPRRVEQERIPLEVARRSVEALTRGRP